MGRRKEKERNGWVEGMKRKGTGGQKEGKERNGWVEGGWKERIGWVEGRKRKGSMIRGRWEGKKERRREEEGKKKGRRRKEEEKKKKRRREEEGKKQGRRREEEGKNKGRRRKEEGKKKERRREEEGRKKGSLCKGKKEIFLNNEYINFKYKVHLRVTFRPYKLLYYSIDHTNHEMEILRFPPPKKNPASE